jgi:hypothetical protein
MNSQENIQLALIAFIFQQITRKIQFALFSQHEKTRSWVYPGKMIV